MKIEVWVALSLVGRKQKKIIEIDDDDWSEMTEEERSAQLNEEAERYLHEQVEYGTRVLE